MCEFSDVQRTGKGNAPMIVTDEMVATSVKVLVSYYGVYVPPAFMKGILEEDEKLALEAQTGGISDTCQREILIDSVLNRLGLRSWPTYGEGDLVFSAFLKDAAFSLEKIGGEIV